MKDNMETVDTDAEQRLRRYYQRRLAPLYHPVIVKGRVHAALDKSHGTRGSDRVQDQPATVTAGRLSRPTGVRGVLRLTGSFALVLLLVLVGITASGWLRNLLASAPLADALTGAVALRTQAEPPGLYIYGASGWQWLQSSDLDSRLRARCTDGDLLYDAPNTAAPIPTIVQAAATAQAGHATVPNAETQISRRLLRSDADGKAPRPLALNPGQWHLFECSEEGVIGVLAVDNVSTSGSAFVPNTFTTAYQPSGRDTVIVPSLPGKNWHIWGASSVGGRLLLVETEGDPPQGAAATGTTSWIMRVYSAGPDGADRRLLTVRHDLLYLGNPTFAPDGSYVLVSFYDPSQYPTRFVNLLLDLTPDRAGVAHEYAGVMTGLSEPTTLAWFFQNGPRRGQLAVASAEENTQHVRVYDPAAPDKPLLDVAVESSFGAWRALTSDPNGAGLAAAWLGQGEHPTLLYVDAQGMAHMQGIELPSGAQIWTAFLRDSHLVFQVALQTPAAGERLPRELMTLPLEGFGDATTRPIRVYAQSSYQPSLDALSGAWMGAQRFAYVSENGELHVRNYDGEGDIVVEQGVSGFSSTGYERLP